MKSSSGSERGSASVELALIAPAIGLLIGFVIVGGRIEVNSGAIDGVAAAAARDASISRTPAQAQATAQQTAAETLAAQGLDCIHQSVTVDTSGFARPLGQPANIRVTVRCTVRLSDIGMPGLPGSRTLTDHFTSALDEYRGR